MQTNALEDFTLYNVETPATIQSFPMRSVRADVTEALQGM